VAETGSFVFAFSFALMQKKQKIQGQPDCSAVCPAIPPLGRNVSNKSSVF